MRGIEAFAWNFRLRSPQRIRGVDKPDRGGPIIGPAPDLVLLPSDPSETVGRVGGFAPTL